MSASAFGAPAATNGHVASLQYWISAGTKSILLFRTHFTWLSFKHFMDHQKNWLKYTVLILQSWRR